MNRELIEQYVAGGEKLRRTVAGLTPEELRARPGPGEWSALVASRGCSTCDVGVRRVLASRRRAAEGGPRSMLPGRYTAGGAAWYNCGQ